MSNSVFLALADPVRRQILERLYGEDSLSLNELAQPLAISRQAVTKHLNILQKAGLISVERVGRERRHRLNAESLRVVADWLKPYSQAWDETLERLQSHLDNSSEH